MPTSSTASSLRIFVVENHSDTLRCLEYCLRGMNHTVVAARSLAAAVAALPDADCDVLLCDIGLPDGDGWEILNRVQFPKPVFAIAMSGFGRKADRARSIAAGFRHHLLKPFIPEELEAILMEAIQEKDLARGEHACR